MYNFSLPCPPGHLSVHHICGPLMICINGSLHSSTGSDTVNYMFEYGPNGLHTAGGSELFYILRYKVTQQLQYQTLQNSFYRALFMNPPVW